MQRQIAGIFEVLRVGGPLGWFARDRARGSAQRAGCTRLEVADVPSVAPVRALWVLGAERAALPRATACSVAPSPLAATSKRLGVNRAVICGLENVMTSSEDRARQQKQRAAGCLPHRDVPGGLLRPPHSKGGVGGGKRTPSVSSSRFSVGRV